MTEANSKKEIYIYPAAERDINDILDFYRNNGGTDLALKWAAAIERHFRALAAFPASGSLRYAEVLNLKDLRFTIVEGFPYLIFYKEYDSRIEIWRVLHAKRDIPTWLRDIE